MSPSPPTLYTEATVELVGRAAYLADWPAATEPDWPLLPANERKGYREQAQAVLNALVKAGLLLPEGAETRTEAKPSTKDLPLQPGDQVAFMSPSLFPGRESERLTGQVVGVADDGYVTASVPQAGHEPMEVTAPADVFARIRLAPDVDAAFAAGRAQAAADIRGMPINNWADDAIGARERAARIAEGGGEADLSKEQA